MLCGILQCCVSNHKLTDHMQHNPLSLSTANKPISAYSVVNFNFDKFAVDWNQVFSSMQIESADRLFQLMALN